MSDKKGHRLCWIAVVLAVSGNLIAVAAFAGWKPAEVITFVSTVFGGG